MYAVLQMYCSYILNLNNTQFQDVQVQVPDKQVQVRKKWIQVKYYKSDCNST